MSEPLLEMESPTTTEEANGAEASAVNPDALERGDLLAHDGVPAALISMRDIWRTYEMGTGYGHIAIGVDDLVAALDALKGQGIEPERPPYTVSDGGSRLCFVRDPDQYRIELIERS